MKRGMGALAGLMLMAQSAPPPSVDDLAWMSGDWAVEQDGRWAEESWSRPRGGVMLGYGRLGRGGEVRDFEFLRIQAGADGVPVYHAQPRGAPAVPFRLAAHDGTSASFENPAHDFPQRIRYVRADDVMTATISRLDGSNATSWSFRRR